MAWEHDCFTTMVRQSEILLLWKGAMTLVLTPFLLLAFMFVLLGSHVDQETALAENCLCKGEKKGSLETDHLPDPDDCMRMPVEGREWERAAGARWEK